MMMMMMIIILIIIILLPTVVQKIINISKPIKATAKTKSYDVSTILNNFKFSHFPPKIIFYWGRGGGGVSTLK